MSQQKEAIKSLEKIQALLGELGYVLTPDGYYKDYGLMNGSAVRIAPLFDRGLSLDMQYDLTSISVAGHEIIPIISGQPVALERVPKEAYGDIMRMLAELAPAALMPKKEQFIINMLCTQCKDEVSSFFNLKGVITCLPCMGYDI